MIPLSPRFAKILLLGRAHGILGYTLLLVAGLSVEEIFRRRFKFEDPGAVEEGGKGGNGKGGKGLLGDFSDMDSDWNDRNEEKKELRRQIEMNEDLIRQRKERRR